MNDMKTTDFLHAVWQKFPELQPKDEGEDVPALYFSELETFSAAAVKQGKLDDLKTLFEIIDRALVEGQDDLMRHLLFSYFFDFVDVEFGNFKNHVSDVMPSNFRTNFEIMKQHKDELKASMNDQNKL